MKFLVLGGGSIKGAWQAGAIRAVLESGYQPDFITGISVGSINGAFLVNARNKESWDGLGKKLWDFWIDHIKRPSDIAIKRKVIQLAWQILRNKFKGLADTTPFWNLIKDNLSYYDIMNSPCRMAAGVVDLDDGKIKYIKSNRSNFIEYVFASAAIPIAFPVSHISNKAYYDGGLRDSAPLKIAFDQNASEIVCIASHPKDLAFEKINTGNLMQLTDRLQEIIVNNNLNNDIEQAELINNLCPSDGSAKPDGPYKGKKRIPLKIIRPVEVLDISLDSFTSKDILRMLKKGYSSV